MASVRAVTDAEVLRIPYAAVRDLLSGGPDAALGIIRTVIGRLRGMEATLRQREKLAGLGTLAAGLAHELNNPAAAIRRSVDALDQAIAARNQMHPPHALHELRPSAARRSSASRAPMRSRRSATWSATEDGRGAGRRRLDGRRAARAFDGLDPDAARDAAAWLAATATVETLLGEVRMAGDRISEIVGAVKSYAYLDQAPVQRIDVRKGLDDTLVILRSQAEGGDRGDARLRPEPARDRGLGLGAEPGLDQPDRQRDRCDGRAWRRSRSAPPRPTASEVQVTHLRHRAGHPARGAAARSSSPSSPPSHQASGAASACTSATTS